MGMRRQFWAVDYRPHLPERKFLQEPGEKIKKRKKETVSRAIYPTVSIPMILFGVVWGLGETLEKFRYGASGQC